MWLQSLQSLLDNKFFFKKKKKSCKNLPSTNYGLQVKILALIKSLHILQHYSKQLNKSSLNTAFWVRYEWVQSSWYVLFYTWTVRSLRAHSHTVNQLALSVETKVYPCTTVAAPSQWHRVCLRVSKANPAANAVRENELVFGQKTHGNMCLNNTVWFRCSSHTSLLVLKAACAWKIFSECSVTSLCLLYDRIK